MVSSLHCLIAVIGLMIIASDTNQWNAHIDKILDICSRYKTSISVSLDGPEPIHDANCVGHKGEGTYCVGLMLLLGCWQ